MPRSPRTLLAATAALATATLVVATMAPATAGAQSRKPVKKNPQATSFAMRAWGYGSSVQGGQVPLGSNATAYEGFGCTNRAGVEVGNQVASANLPQLGTLAAVKTRAWTTREGATVSSWAENTIGKVVLSDSPLGTLLLDAVSTTARSYWDGTRFRTDTHTDLAKLSFQPPIGPAQTLALPAPGRPVQIPGFATVTIAHSLTGTSAQGARAFANGLKVQLHATGTTVRVAHAVAHISAGARSGLFRGSSYAVNGTAAGDIVNLGRNPLLKMNCAGTQGKVGTRALASADLGGQVVLGAATSEQMGQQNARRAWGFERSRVASLNLGGGQLRIEGVIGQVNVSRSVAKPGTISRNIRGTSIGRIYVNGQLQEFPDTGVIEIPGVAKIEPHVTTNLANGIAVTALRITVLDGTGAVINLGNADLQIRRPAR